LGGVTSLGYDAAGNTTAVIDPLGHETDFAFDKLGRVGTLTQAVGTSVQRSLTVAYDAAGNATSLTDPLGHLTQQSFDALNRLTVLTEAAGASEQRTTTYSYDAVGNNTSTVDPLGHTTQRTFDGLNRITVLTEAVGASEQRTTTLVYDLAGNVTSVVDALGRTTSYSYDAFNLGYVHAQSGNLSEAVTSYTRALRSDPGLRAARVNRGLALLELKRYQESLADLDQALAQGKDDAPLHASRGMALEGLGRHPEADAVFRLAFGRAATVPVPTRQRMRWTYGFAVARRLPKEERRAFEAVLEEDARNAQACYGIAMLAMEEGDSAEALRFFDQALETAPNFFPARRYRAVQWARKGSLKGASEDINWCLEKEPRSGASLYAAACVAALAFQQLSDPKLATQAQDLLERAFTHGVGLDTVDRVPDLAGIRAHSAIWQRVLQAKARFAHRK
jgi:YD repeat-containing protein